MKTVNAPMAERSHPTPAAGPVVLMLARREVLRFLRQPARLAAALGTPLLFWLFLSGGFAAALDRAALGGMSYGAFLLPGMITLAVLFASIFSSITTIDDRASGWLQPALVSPTPRWVIGLGKVLGGGLVAWLHAVVLLLLWPLVADTLSITGAVLALGLSLLIALALSALGLAFAWRSPDTGSFHAVMNLVLMPLWLLSGAFFSIDGAATWMQWVLRLNPLAWCTDAMRLALHDGTVGLSVLGTLFFTSVTVLLALAVVCRPERAGGKAAA